MNYKYFSIILIILFSLLYSEEYTGYVRQIEASWCMDECSEYYIESEGGNYIGNIISLSASISLDQYVDRFVDITAGEEYWCVECGALDVNEILIASDCPDTEVYCFQNPCLVESCPAYPNADCVPNYCDGCHADFYDVNGELITNCDSTSSCSGSNPAGCFQNGCPNGYECIDDWESNCVSSCKSMTLGPCTGQKVTNQSVAVATV